MHQLGNVFRSYLLNIRYARATFLFEVVDFRNEFYHLKAEQLIAMYSCFQPQMMEGVMWEEYFGCHSVSSESPFPHAFHTVQATGICLSNEPLTKAMRPTADFVTYKRAGGHIRVHYTMALPIHIYSKCVKTIENKATHHYLKQS